jgi:hypothetical protein
MLTLEMIEAEFWGLEREQPIRTRLRRAVALVLEHCLDRGVHSVLNDLAGDIRRAEDAVGLIHKLQTEIGELRTELAQLKRQSPPLPVGLQIIPTCQWTYNKAWEIYPYRTSCGYTFMQQHEGKCPKCERHLVVVEVK